MQAASYHIDLLERGVLVSSTLVGFFNLSDVADYVRDAERVIHAVYHRHGQYRMILDVSGCAIQSQDVIGAFITHVGRMPISSRSAIVVGSSIVRMQVRRVMDRPNAALFEDRDAALAWLQDMPLDQVA